MSVLSKPYFHNEAAAFEFVEGIIWNGEPSCPHCGVVGKVYDLKGVRSKPSQKNPEGVERHGLKKCASCRKQFTVRIGTIFEESHLPLHKWLQAIYLMCSSKKGISAKQLERTLECTYKTAWFLAHRIREAMRSGDLTPFGGVVEADETYFGRVETPRTHSAIGLPYKGKKGGGPANKMAVVTLVQRGGRVRSFHVDRATKATVTGIVSENIAREATLYTDESRLYTDAKKHVAAHESVRHTGGEYVRGDVTTNTVEGYFSIFKRGMKGVYQHCSEKHLHRYLAEFDFRYSEREALGVDDQERAMKALIGGVGKRLTYRRTDAESQA